MGTADYLSPESSEDARRADIRSDLYSLGCTLYFLLSGRPPFAGPTAIETILQHRAGLPTPIEISAPGIAAGPAAVLRRLMSLRPEDRYQTPAAAAVALAEFALPAAEGPDRPSDPFLDRPGADRGTRPGRRAALAAAAVILFIAVLVRAIGAGDRDRDVVLPAVVTLGVGPTGEPTNRIASHIERARGLLNRGEAARAIIVLDEAIALDPTNPWPYNWRGTAYLISKDKARAIADYSRAIEIAPGHPTFLANRGEAFGQSGDMARGIADLDEAIRRAPGQAHLWRRRGDLLVQIGDDFRAIADYTEAIRRDPNDRAAYQGRSRAHTRRGDLEKAAADADAARQNGRDRGTAA